MSSSGKRITLLLMLLASALIPLDSGVDAQEDDRPATPAPVTASCGASPSGALLYLPFNEQEETDGTLHIYSFSAGGDQAVEGLDDASQVIPLQTPGKALVWTESERLYLVDIASRVATDFKIDPDRGPLFEDLTAIPAQLTPEITILTNGRDAFVLDSNGGVLTEIRPLLNSAMERAPLLTSLSPDGEHLLIWDTLTLWLMPLDAPSSVWPLAPGITALPGSFSADGSLVIYSRATETGKLRELVIEPVDGSAAPEVVATADVITGVFAGVNDRLAIEQVNRTDGPPVAEVGLLDLGTGDYTTLLEHDVLPVSLRVDPTGKTLLVSLNDVDAGWIYHAIDLASGEISDLPEIEGLYLTGQFGGQFVLATPLVNSGFTPPNPGVYRVDLTAGTANLLAPLDLDDLFAVGAPQYNRDRNRALLGLFGKEEQSLLAIDLTAGAATPVLTTPFSGSAISPDGCWFAYVARDPTSEDSPPAIIYRSIDGSEGTALVSGFLGVWVETEE